MKIKGTAFNAPGHQNALFKALRAGSWLPALSCLWVASLWVASLWVTSALVSSDLLAFEKAPPIGIRERAAPPSGAADRSAISMDRAIAMVERRYQARVVRADVSESDGRRLYVLRLLSEEGRVWTVRMDANSGAMN